MNVMIDGLLESISFLNNSDNWRYTEFCTFVHGLDLQLQFDTIAYFNPFCVLHLYVITSKLLIRYLYIRVSE